MARTASNDRNALRAQYSIAPWNAFFDRRLGTRDNILRRDTNSYDEVQLCRDLRGFQDVKSGYGGVVVCGPPWDPWGWEVTEEFALKWPWVIWACQRLFDSTNHWRATRGESPLFARHGSNYVRRDYPQGLGSSKPWIINRDSLLSNIRCLFLT